MREDEKPQQSKIESPVERKAFNDHAAGWEQYTRTPLGRLRQELVTRQLLEHLRGGCSGLRILDAGAGTGGCALSLAQEGHNVCLVDCSSAMLDIARQNFEDAKPEALERVQFHCCSVEGIPDRFQSGSFDVLLCHVLLEYLTEPFKALQDLLALLAPGGTVSLVLVNPYAEMLHWALIKKDLQQAIGSLRAPEPRAGLFGLPRRVVTRAAVLDVLTETGIHTTAEYGVRVVADYFQPHVLADESFYANLLQLELSAGQMEPYRRIARYSHIIGVKRLA
jgi:S-adenosylmethionine-dependent methyltransferase